MRSNVRVFSVSRFSFCLFFTCVHGVPHSRGQRPGYLRFFTNYEKCWIQGFWGVVDKVRLQLLSVSDLNSRQCTERFVKITFFSWVINKMLYTGQTYIMLYLFLFHTFNLILLPTHPSLHTHTHTLFTSVTALLRWQHLKRQHSRKKPTCPPTHTNTAHSYKASITSVLSLLWWSAVEGSRRTVVHPWVPYWPPLQGYLPIT